MINIETKHLEIVKTILSKYNYSFFLFGSRITPNVKRFSDIDILYFENIPNAVVLKLEEDLEESNLPYKVDLVNYNKCYDSFREIIGSKYVCLQSSLKLQLIEQNHLSHFEFSPKSLGFDVYEKDNLRIVNCGLGSSMFNIIYGAPSSYEEIHSTIAEVKKDFKGQPFAWWVPPSLKNPNLSKCLLQAGLVIETTEHAMICDLRNIAKLEPKTDLLVKPVFDGPELKDFIRVLEPYDHSARRFYEKMSGNNLRSAEKLLVGYVEDRAVTIAILFTAASASGIFSLLTCEHEQSKGYGTDMMRYLLQVAKESGSKYVTLSASSNSGYRIYEQLGFYKIGEFECYEYKGTQCAS